MKCCIALINTIEQLITSPGLVYRKQLAASRIGNNAHALQFQVQTLSILQKERIVEEFRDRRAREARDSHDSFAVWAEEDLNLDTMLYQ